MKINSYKIKRNHSNNTGFFIVDVSEIKQYGLGFQIKFKGVIYGLSITNN